MCGINGFTGFEDKALLKCMNQLVENRGPDDQGYYSDSKVSLAHRRLSILDLSKKGKQPMSNKQSTITIVYNGEIYNFREIQQELEKKGYRFSSTSDTEVILAAYEEYGVKCLSKFNGMFAFAIHDKRKGKNVLFLARDRLGIKPLHYTFVNDNLLFASEIKSLLVHKELKRKVNPDALHKFLNFNYIFGGDTLFLGINKLLPGHYLLFDVKTKSYSIKQYWDLPVTKTNHSEGYYVKQIQEQLKESVRKRLVSDVPLGVFLSGGIDSSSIVALMNQLDETKKPIKTYAVGFNEPWDELKDAQRVSDKFGTDHQEILVESNALEQFPEFIWHMDTPKTNISPQYYISKLARKSVAVALTGLGGDELFVGYRRHKYYYHQKTFSAVIPKFIGKPLFSTLSKAALSNYLKRGMVYLANVHDKEHTYSIAVPLLLFNNERKQLYGEKLKKKGVNNVKELLVPYFKEKGVDYYNQTLKMEIKTYLNDDLLERMDRMSMAHGLEARVPFLDHTFVEFAFSIPNKYRRFKLGSTAGKDILVKSMKGIVPEFVFSKKKAGFNMSPYYWYKSHMKDHIGNILTEQRIKELGLFNSGYINKVISQKPSPNLYYQYQTLWNIMAFDIWHKIYIEGDPSKTPPKKISKYYN